jgi:hypothetical protein
MRRLRPLPLHTTEGDGEVKEPFLSTGAEKPAQSPSRWRRWCPDFRQLKEFQTGYWHPCILSIVGLGPVSSFGSIIPALLKQRWEAQGRTPSVVEINDTTLILNSVAAGSALFSGWVLGKVGNYAAFLLASQLAIASCHAALAFSAVTNEPAILAVMGLSFATFASAFWSYIASFVPVSALGLSYGLMGAVQNAGLASMPFLISALQPPASCGDSYACLETAFTGVSSVGALVSLALVILDLRSRRAKKQKDQTVKDWATLKGENK